MKDGRPTDGNTNKTTGRERAGPRAIWSYQEANRDPELKLSSKLSFKKQGERVK